MSDHMAVLGALIELFQWLDARTRDSVDMPTNLLGLAIGATLGLGARLTYGYLKGELVSAQIRRHLVRVRVGVTIFNEGERVNAVFISHSTSLGSALPRDQRTSTTAGAVRPPGQCARWTRWTRADITWSSTTSVG